MNDEQGPTTPEERLRDARATEARGERLLHGEHERQQRTAAIERAFGTYNERRAGRLG